MQTDDSYQLLDARVMELYREQNYAGAFDLLTAEGPRHPGKEIDEAWWRPIKSGEFRQYYEQQYRRRLDEGATCGS